MATESELSLLVAELPLPTRWARPELFQEAVDVGGCTVHLVGVSTRRADGELAWGSAAELVAAPVRRAYFELLERVATLDALAEPAREQLVRDESGRPLGVVDSAVVFPRPPARTSWRYARSNGIASHVTWPAACASARLELVERDCVLRSWYGGERPQPQPVCDALVPRELREVYDIQACSLPPARHAAFTLAATRPVVAAVLAFPRSRDAPMAYGFAARHTLASALREAARECLQSLAFLWGEPIPDRQPAPSADPSFHQDFYLNPDQHHRLRRWLCGEHATRAHRLEPPARVAFGFVDLTPAALRGRLHVAKALPDGELPLTFGPGHPSVIGALPAELSVHPIA